MGFLRWYRGFTREQGGFTQLTRLIDKSENKQ
ncbi:hypothetical protein PODOV006v2_p0015 [Vibrio phage 15E36.1]|uniref:Uncharacterized protein n=1 Tax=Vibrio phage 15E36.1 TaxID=2859290 RepID=A0AAE7XZZ4_9CAUD|nr:hypothetical protein PODOV006v2_p0015 [Vibrio phage 15E36.1]